MTLLAQEYQGFFAQGPGVGGIEDEEVIDDGQRSRGWLGPEPFKE